MTKRSPIQPEPRPGAPRDPLEGFAPCRRCWDWFPAEQMGPIEGEFPALLFCAACREKARQR